MGFDQQRRELFALPLPAADGERAKGDAMVALTSRDQIAPLRLAAFNKILSRELQRGFDRFGTTADVEYIVESIRGMRGKIVCKLFGGLGRKKAGVRVFQLIKLRAHGAEHIGVRVAQAGHCCTTGGVDIFLAGLVANIYALARNGCWVLVSDGSVQYVRHGRPRPRRSSQRCNLGNARSISIGKIFGYII